MAIIYEEDNFTLDELPGYASPTRFTDHAPKANRTILDNTEGFDVQAVQYNVGNDTDDRLLEKAWRKHDVMKAEFQHIACLTQKRNEKQKFAREKLQGKTGWNQLSRIPLPIFWYHQAKECPVTSLVKTVGQSGVKAFQIPKSPTAKECAVQNIRTSIPSAGGKPSRSPVPNAAMKRVQRYPHSSVQEVPYTVYHTPGKHVTIIPQVQDTLLRQRKSRLPVWMNSLRMSLTKSETKNGLFCPGREDSQIPLPVSHIKGTKNVCKASTMKRAKRAVMKKLKNFSPRLDKFFKRLS